MGASDSKSRSTGDVERFLCMLRFDSKGKLDQLGVDLSTLDGHWCINQRTGALRPSDASDQAT